jgi:hypothetical protein
MVQLMSAAAKLPTAGDLPVAQPSYVLPTAK